ncbi:DUF6461 domain-containing protein [Streptomyces sp. NPDC051018]|uniref:DUF6461 domain-containing protein n=1 Tax=Streptomyces sp. NPDC051018 TaxID=3365639 RepID=UPI0037A64A99
MSTSTGVGAFLWAEDQVLWCCFDPLFPKDRWGTVLDELPDIMRRIGFHFGEAAPETDLSSPTAFALAEHLTDIASTPASPRDSTLTCVTVQVR